MSRLLILLQPSLCRTYPCAYALYTARTLVNVELLPGNINSAAPIFTMPHWFSSTPRGATRARAMCCVSQTVAGFGDAHGEACVNAGALILAARSG
jgi:hypothetical protein